MRSVAIAPAPDRADLFQEARDVLGIDAALIEKDFWVCQKDTFVRGNN